MRERTRDRLVDDEHRAATDELLRLRQREVGLDARRVAVHHQADRARRCEHRRLRVAHAVLLAELDRLVPRRLRRAQQVGRHELFVDLGGFGAVHAQHVEHRFGVGGVARERAHACRGLRARRVRVTRHERRDRTGPRPTGVGVVRHALRPSAAHRGSRSRARAGGTRDSSARSSRSGSRRCRRGSPAR